VSSGDYLRVAETIDLDVTCPIIRDRSGTGGRLTLALSPVYCRQYKHPTKPGVVTLPGKPNDDLAPGTLNSVLKQAGLKE
jgi:hypothetical protein